MSTMKKWTALMLAMILACACTAFAGGEAADASLQKVLDKGTFVLGFDASFPPMGYTDENGDYVGFDLDAAKEVASRLGVELVLQAIDWSAKDLELNSGNIDCIWNGMTVTQERVDSMSLSIPYLENAQVVCVLKDSPYQSLADLNGKTVAVQSASSGAEALEAAADFRASLSQVVEFPDYAMALMDLDNKGADAVVIDVVVANYYIAKKNADYRLLSETLAPELYAIGFRKGDAALTDKVNEILLEMAEDGALAAISQEWFAGDITVVKEQAAKAQ